jgi:hypothetical protein
MCTCEEMEIAWIVEFGPANTLPFSICLTYRQRLTPSDIKFKPHLATREREKERRREFKHKHTNKNIIPNLHGIIMHLAPTNPARRLNHTALANHRAPPDTDARGRHVFAGRRRRGAGGVQVAAQLHVGHDDGAAAEGDVGRSCNGAAARDFVARVLWGVLMGAWKAVVLLESGKGTG